MEKVRGLQNLAFQLGLDEGTRQFRLYNLYQVSQISLINQEILESVVDAINFDLWVEREEF